MCYGSQEYFVSCLHPGNFQIREYCRNWTGCTGRVEEQTIHVPGFCPACQHTAYTDQPRGRSDRPRTGGTPWSSYEEMVDHYGGLIVAAEQRVANAQYYFDLNPRGFREELELRQAQQELGDAQRGWERDEGDFRADEMRRDDQMSYGAYEGW